MQDAQSLDNWNRQFRLATNHESCFASYKSLTSDEYAHEIGKSVKTP